MENVDKAVRSALDAQRSLVEGIAAFSKKYSADQSLLSYISQSQSFAPENLETQILRAALKAIELLVPHPETKNPLQFQHLFPPTTDPALEQSRAHLFLSTLKESIPPAVQEKACSLAEPNTTLCTEDLVDLSNQMGEILNSTPHLQPLLLNTLPPPLWAAASPDNPVRASHLGTAIEITGIAGSRDGIAYLRTRDGKILASTEISPPPPLTPPPPAPPSHAESTASATIEISAALPETSPTEDPTPENSTTENPTTENPTTEKPSTEKPSTEKPSPPSSAPPPPPTLNPPAPEQTPQERKVQRIIETWYRSQIGVEIEDLPLDKKLELQGIPSPEDIARPQKKNRLAQAAKVAGFLACWVIWPPCTVVLIGAIITQKYLIKQNRNPQTREKKFLKEYGPQFHPEKEPWNRQIASEILSAGVDLHTNLENGGQATQKLVVLGSCTEAEKTWACEEKALHSLSEKGYRVLSLETPRDLPASAIEEIKTFRELTENCHPQRLLQEAKKFLGEYGHEEWALTLARTSLANQLNLKVAFNGAPTQKQVALQESFQKLTYDLALQSKETTRDVLSNLHGGPMAAANLEMARREITLEKTKDTVRNLLDYAEEKTIHLCSGRNSFALQEAWAHLTQKRPLALQIAPPHNRYPWNPWGVDNPATSENAMPITAETVKAQLGPSHTKIPITPPPKPTPKKAPLKTPKDIG